MLQTSIYHSENIKENQIDFSGNLEFTYSKSSNYCAPGTWNVTSGQEPCVPASPGHFVNTSGAFTQIPCPPGSFQPLSGQISCLNATPGHFVENNSYSSNSTRKIASYGTFNGHTCSILDNNKLSCWGANDWGELGDGTNTDRLTPTLVSNIEPEQSIIEISVGGSHTCALFDSGIVNCWGNGPSGDNFGYNFSGNVTTPGYALDFGNNKSAISIASGLSHACAILDDGSVSCWGNNNWGQLGDGTTTSRLTPTPTSSLGIGRTAVKIAIGAWHTCTILDDGTVSCWGENNYGNLGFGQSSPDKHSPTPTLPFSHGRTAVDISLGTYHTCALLNDGNVTCWGSNEFGMLGDDQGANRYYPATTVVLPQNRTATDISLGTRHACIILDNGTVSCWGGNNYGQLGDDTTTSRTTPTPTSSIDTNLDAVEIGVGDYTTCIILDDGSIRCWGFGRGGQIGDGDTEHRYTPTSTASLGVGRSAKFGEIHLSHKGQSFQTPCPIGTYQPNGGQESCLNATTGHYVDSLGQSFQIPCLAGTYNPYESSTSVESCLPASPGHFVESDGQSNQIPCQPGSYNPSNSSSDPCIPSSPGHFVEMEGADSQTPCLPGTYQPGEFNIICLSTSPGHYTINNSSVEQLPCPPGTYQPYSNSTNCLFADKGHYSSGGSNTEQTPCMPGTYQDKLNQTSCLQTEPGFYTSEWRSFGPIPCTPGSFQDAFGQIECKITNEGHYTDTNASTIEIPCMKGTYQPEKGQTFCLTSDRGNYVDIEGSTLQFPCALGTYQPYTNQSSCLPASLGYFVNMEGSITQQIAFLDTYSDSTGSITPDNCPTLHITLNPGAISIQECHLDSDGDRIPNNIDHDDDADGIEDSIDSCPLGEVNWISYYFTDNDGDGCKDINEDVDDDNDGYLDNEDDFPLNQLEWRDNDLDGIGDNQDNDDDNDGLSDLFEINSGTNYLLYDTDLDGFSDKSDAFPLNPVEWLDSDGDGVGDNSDYMQTISFYQTQGQLFLHLVIILVMTIPTILFFKNRTEFLGLSLTLQLEDDEEE